MRFRQLQGFVAVATHGSFSAASVQLNMSQSALSYQIRTLEEELQVELFERQPRGVRMTEAGTAILPVARKVLSDTAQARRTMRSRYENAREETFLLGVTPTPARLFIPDMLVASSGDRQFRVELRHGFSGGHYADITRGELDFALCFRPDGSPLTGFALYEEDVFMIGPPNLVVTEDGDLPFERLGEFPLVLTKAAHLARRRIEQLARERAVSLNVVLEIDMIDVQRQLVVEHRRCTLASYGLFMNELNAGLLGMRRIVEPAITRTMMLFARPDMPAAVVDHFWHLLRSSVHAKVREKPDAYRWLRLAA